MLIRAYLTILMIFNAFPFFSFKPTTEQSHSISPHTSIFPAPISKILWAGTNQNKDCKEMCKDLCFKNSLGENCLHSCGCVLGNNIIYLLLTNGQLFRSTDMGKIWDDESIGLLESFERFTKLNKHLNSLKSNEEFLLIKDIIPNPQNHDILWILGKSSLNWKTEDAGDTYGIWYIETEGHILKVSSIFLHPTRNNSLLATSLSPEICENWAAELSSDCKQALYVSHDNGKQWDLVDKNVKKFGWGNSGKFFNKINTRFHQHYVFGTAKNISEEINPITTVDWSTIYFSKSNGRNEVMMIKILLSHNLEHYAAITFSDNMNPMITSFTFFEDKHNVMFLFLHEKGTNHGTLYRSDSTGQRFTKLLPNLHQNPSHLQLDFLEIQSLDGVFLANIVFLKPKGNEVEQKIQTVISYDNGNKWHNLPAPKFDHLGKAILCGYKDQCHLHLALTLQHGKSQSVITKPKSIGVILSLGNLGDELLEDIDSLHPFLSIDGGITWRTLASKPSFQNFGDLGSLLLMGFGDLNLKYSWNMGYNWTNLPIDNLQESTIINILSHPLDNAQEFLIIAKTESSDSTILILLDFSEFNPPQCQIPDDYDLFTPKAYEETCILGRKITYLRKKPEVQCYNGLDFEPIQKQENCDCGVWDYECDWGFYKYNGVCEAISLRLVQTNFSIECYNMHQKHYLYSMGYRKIMGDTCEGKTVFDPVFLDCPIYFLGLSKKQLNWLIVGVILMVLVWIGYEKRLWIKMRFLSIWGDLTHCGQINKDDIVFSDISYNEEETSDLMFNNNKEKESP